MVEYYCARCDKKFTHKGDYQKHINRKLPCQKCDKNIPESTKKTTNFEYKLEPFELDVDHRFGHGRCYALIMASGAGKTTLIKYMIKKYFKDYITFMYASNLNSDIYDDLSKDVITTYEFNPKWVKFQKKINQQFKKKPFRFLNILDDQVSNNTKNDEMVKRLATSYRNSSISTIVTAQYNKMLSRPLRGNCKMILGALRTDEDIKDVIQLYAGMIFNGLGLNMSQKIETYRMLTSNYQFIILNNNSYKISKINI
jgi:DNA-directed RNA polymerase subunit RPC12/RpoP/energy-coupling factor transporter ATP-binding protein EcfA2